MVIHTKKIILIGSTGNGKSTLANVLLNKNDNFEEVFKESEGSVSETRNIQIEKAEIDLDKKGNEKLELVIIDTVGIGDTKLTTQGVLYKLAEAASHMGEGLNQIFFVSSGRFTEKEEEAYRLLSSVIFDNEVVNFTTIIRTHFARFNNEVVCQKDREAIQEENSRLSNIVNSSKFIYVDNPAMIGDPEVIESAKKIRLQSRQILLTHLGTCRDVYKPRNLDKLNDRIKNYMTEEERLEKEIEEAKSLIREQKETSAQEIKWLNDQTRELKERNEKAGKDNKRQIDELREQLNEKNDLLAALSSFYNLPGILKTGFSSKSLKEQVYYLKNEFERVVRERAKAEENELKYLKEKKELLDENKGLLNEKNDLLDENSELLDEKEELLAALSSFYNLEEVRSSETRFSSKSLKEQVYYLKREFERVVRERARAKENELQYLTQLDQLDLLHLFH